MRFSSLLILLFSIIIIGKHNSESYFHNLFTSEKIQEMIKNKSWLDDNNGKYIFYNDARLI